MKPAPFDYLVPLDLNRVTDVAYIREQDGWLSVGALTRQHAVESSPLVRERWPLLHEVMPYIGHRAIRNRGTVGGSLAHADPSAELPAVASALGAELVVQGPGGTRTLSADAFFVSYLTTSLAPTEMLIEVRFPPLPAATGQAWLEYARRHGDFALAGVAATVRLADDGTCAMVRLVFTGVGAVPYDARPAAALLVGQQPTSELFAEAAEQAAAAVEPDADLHASAEYRRHLVRVLGRKALALATDRAHAA
jgi:CO/xanthine dehydrogenase FAD-binding subunit